MQNHRTHSAIRLKINEATPITPDRNTAGKRPPPGKKPEGKVERTVANLDQASAEHRRSERQKERGTKTRTTTGKRRGDETTQHPTTKRRKTMCAPTRGNPPTAAKPKEDTPQHAPPNGINKARNYNPRKDDRLDTGKIADEPTDDTTITNRLRSISTVILKAYNDAINHRTPELIKNLTETYLTTMENATRQAVEAKKRILREEQAQIGAQNARIDHFEEKAEERQRENALQFSSLKETVSGIQTEVAKFTKTNTKLAADIPQQGEKQEENTAFIIAQLKALAKPNTVMAP